MLPAAVMHLYTFDAKIFKCALHSACISLDHDSCLLMAYGTSYFEKVILLVRDF